MIASKIDQSKDSQYLLQLIMNSTYKQLKAFFDKETITKIVSNAFKMNNLKCNISSKDIETYL